MRKRGKPARVTRRVEIAGAPDRPAAEALYLELRRLAERHGVALTALRIEPEDREPPPHRRPSVGGEGLRRAPLH